MSLLFIKQDNNVDILEHKRLNPEKIKIKDENVN